MGTKTKITVLLLCILIGVAAAAAGVTLIQYWYPNTGIINKPSLKLYIDTIYYPNETAIDWGSCDVNSTYYFENMTVINTGNTNLTVYIIPAGLPSTWTLTWTGNDTFLMPTQKVEGELSLTIPASAATWPTWGFYLRGR